MTDDILERDAKVIAGIEKLRFFPIAPVGGEGCYLIEADGRRLLDFSGSWGAAGLGYNHAAIVESIGKAARSMASASLLSYVTEPAISLAEELLAILPGNTPRKVWFGHSGSDANDMIVRLVQAVTGRKRFITFHGAYHGGISGSISVSGHSSQQHSRAQDGVVYLHYPDPYRPQFDGDLVQGVLTQLDELFATSCPPDEVAAVFIEPIQSDGGVIVPPTGFMKALEQRCRDHGIFVVVDEVKVGLGRSGLMHAFEHDGLAPDIVSFGKALGGGVPLSAVVGPAEIMDFAPAFSILTTSGNPVAASAGRAVLRTIQADDLIANAASVGETLMEGLRQLADKYALIGDVRGRGLAIGAELVRDRDTREAASLETKKLVYRAYELGLVLFYVGMQSNVLEFTPPLILTKHQAAAGLQTLDQAFDDVVNGRVADEAVDDFAGW